MRNFVYNSFYDIMQFLTQIKINAKLGNFQLLSSKTLTFWQNKLGNTLKPDGKGKKGRGLDLAYLRNIRRW